MKLNSRLLKKHRKNKPNQHKRYGEKRDRDNKKLFVLDKDNFFGIKYNKMVDLVDTINKEYVIINLDRQRIQLSPSNEVITITTNENCVAKIVKTIDKINYLIIEGGE